MAAGNRERDDHLRARLRARRRGHLRVCLLAGRLPALLLNARLNLWRRTLPLPEVQSHLRHVSCLTGEPV